MYFNILKTSEWDILNPGKNQLVVASLKGSDAKEDHCVMVFDNWIFDSNFDFALPLSKESLDLCCSSDDTHETFVSIREARLCWYGDVMDLKRKQQAQTNSRNQKKK